MNILKRERSCNRSQRGVGSRNSVASFGIIFYGTGKVFFPYILSAMSEHSPFEGLGDLKPRHGSFSTRNRSSWKELQIAVKQAKSVQQSLINRVPHSFTFCENKLYFLAVPFGSRENSIHYVDLPSSENGSRDEQNVDFIPLAWKPLLDSFRISRSFSGYSREEQLLRERKRLGAFGITSYDFDETCRRFMFSASSSLYTCTDWRMDEEV